MMHDTHSLELRTILASNERLVVLWLDEANRGAFLSERGGGSVFGIREAKGLEFPDVAVLDFFSGIPSSDQKVWKALLAADDHQISQSSLSPQVETQLKFSTRRFLSAILLKPRSQWRGRRSFRGFKGSNWLSLFCSKKV